MSLQILRGLSHTQDGDQVVAHRSLNFGSTDIVVLAVIPAPLGMSHEDIPAVECPEKNPRNISRMGSFVVHGQVLCTQDKGQAVGIDKGLN
jgi:hypothetical protein